MTVNGSLSLWQRGKQLVYGGTVPLWQQGRKLVYGTDIGKQTRQTSRPYGLRLYLSVDQYIGVVIFRFLGFPIGRFTASGLSPFTVPVS